MTGYTVHTGASKKFVAGWDRIFSGDSDPATKAAEGSGKSKAAGKTKSKSSKTSKSKKRK